MLFLDVLNCHKREGSQVVTIFKRETYGRILFTYLLYPLIIIMYMYFVLVLTGHNTVFNPILCNVPCELLKVKMANCIFGDQVRKQNFLAFHNYVYTFLVVLQDIICISIIPHN